MEHEVIIAPEHFTPVHTLVGACQAEGEPALWVEKQPGLTQPDINSYARVKGLTFHNGVIRARVRSCLLPDAPPEARGFLGIVFRAAEDDSAFEGFYVRPANGRSCTDPVRRAHGCQYFAYPKYSFLYFRERGITRYEAPTQTDLDEWIDLRAVVEEDTAAFYLNGGNDPVLTVAGLKHGPRARGGVGIFVDNGTRGLVSRLWVDCTD